MGSQALAWHINMGRSSPTPWCDQPSGVDGLPHCSMAHRVGVIDCQSVHVTEKAHCQCEMSLHNADPLFNRAVHEMALGPQGWLQGSTGSKKASCSGDRVHTLALCRQCICMCSPPNTHIQGGGGGCDGNMRENLYFKSVRNFSLNSEAAVRSKLVSRFSHLGALPPCLGLVRVVLPMVLAVMRHPMASSLAVFEAPHRGDF